jgi:hypothetical protein
LRIRIEFDWEMNVFGRHSQFGADTVEAELHVGFRKRGNCSVGPIGPQMPTGLSGVACCQARIYSSASAQ